MRFGTLDRSLIVALDALLTERSVLLAADRLSIWPRHRALRMLDRKTFLFLLTPLFRTRK